MSEESQIHGEQIAIENERRLRQYETNGFIALYEIGKGAKRVENAREILEQDTPKVQTPVRGSRYNVLPDVRSA